MSDRSIDLMYFIRRNAHKFSDATWIGHSVSHLPVPDGFTQRLKEFSEGSEQSISIRLHPRGETPAEAMEFIHGIAKRCTTAKDSGFSYEVSTDTKDVLLCVKKG